MMFFSSVHCHSQIHCVKCRSTITGKTWRKEISESFDDVTSVDFECPKGKPWIKPKMKLEGKKVFLDGKECVPCSKKKERP